MEGGAGIHADRPTSTVACHQDMLQSLFNGHFGHENLSERVNVTVM